MRTKWGTSGLLVACLHVGCGSNELAETSQSVTDEDTGDGSDSLPAESAGTSTESGPGVPDDFGGTVRASLPLTAEESAALDKANALHDARNPSSKPITDRGFGKAKPEKPGPKEVQP